MAVGRKRTKNLHLPAGVTEKEGVWYWQPTTERERKERRAHRAKTGEPVGVTLGPADTEAARKKWAELAGFRDAPAQEGTVAELLQLWKRDGLKFRPNGKPRAEGTIESYTRRIPLLLEKFGAARYGKTSFEASRSKAIGPADIQRFITEHQKKGIANLCFAVLDNAFSHGIRTGRTTYNPCEDVVKHSPDPRTREALPWEVACLRPLAAARLGLQMDFEAITGWRISEILAMDRRQITADGVRVKKSKKGKRELWEWTPELTRIIAEAAKLRGATPFPASPVFPTVRGKRMAYETFNGEWQRLKRATNAMLAQCEVPLVIEDLHFHDLRSKARDDAVDAGQRGHEFLGITAGVDRTSYARREQRRRPLK